MWAGVGKDGKADVRCRCAGCKTPMLVEVDTRDQEPNFLFSAFCALCERITVMKMFRPVKGRTHARYYRGEVEKDDRKMEDI